MFKFVCLVALLAVVGAASIPETTTEKKETVQLLRYESDHNPDGSFRFEFEGDDKSFREETGVVQNAGTDEEALEVSGSYRYIDANGETVEVHYTAGKNGFVPTGTHILAEISAAAKAAADLPHVVEESDSKAEKVQDKPKKA